MKEGARLDLTKVFDLHLIGDMQLSFRKRLSHTVVFMDRDAHVLVDEAGVVPKGEGHRPHPCEHCQHILEAAGAEICHKSDKEAAEIAGTLRKPLLYKCWTSKSNFAIPITVGGMDVIGNLYAGQFFAVVDGEREKRIAERLCVDRGFVVHDGKDPFDNPTKSVLPGFFRTRDEIELEASQQEPIQEAARIEASLSRLESSWKTVPRIPYQQALDSVDLLRSVANTFATQAYETLAYRLAHDIRDATTKFIMMFSEAKRDTDSWVEEASELINNMVWRIEGVAAVTEQLAILYIEILKSLITRRFETTLRHLGRKIWIADLTGRADDLQRYKEELESLWREIDELQPKRATFLQRA